MSALPARLSGHCIAGAWRPERALGSLSLQMVTDGYEAARGLDAKPCSVLCKSSKHS